MSNLPKSIFDLLEHMQFRENAPLYLGKRSISSLDSFLHGYFYAIDANCIDIKDPVRFGDFHDWVANYFGWFESTAGWKNIILQECGGDEHAALVKFFELYDLFKIR